MESDGQCAVQALQKAFSVKDNMMEFVVRACNWGPLTRVNAMVRFSHIIGVHVEFNRVADFLSHDKVDHDHDEADV